MERLTCGIVEDVLQSYLDGVLSKSVKEEVEMHLAGCEHCQKAMQSLLEEGERERLAELTRGKRFMQKLKSARHYLLGFVIGISLPFLAVMLLSLLLALINYVQMRTLRGTL